MWCYTQYFESANIVQSRNSQSATANKFIPRQRYEPARGVVSLRQAGAPTLGKVPVERATAPVDLGMAPVDLGGTALGIAPKAPDAEVPGVEFAGLPDADDPAEADAAAIRSRNPITRATSRARLYSGFLLLSCFSRSRDTEVDPR